MRHKQRMLEGVEVFMFLANKTRVRLLKMCSKQAPSALDGAHGLKGALAHAQILGDLAAHIGFDWEHPKDALMKVREETQEVEQALQGDDAEHIAEEIGDLLFAVCMVARKAGVHATHALEQANQKFTHRFGAIEQEMLARGQQPGQVPLDELEEIWQEVKRQEHSE